ncbi:putative T7SS-secreted protein [Actinophytocola sp.]|uniref:putative T7SS-secreted protein n=1 Tax=Actinophytocola sp. TaxID=1872138 RepID=UPI003D6B9B64
MTSQLGSTTDPKALIPGEPSTVDGDADALGREGDALANVADGLVDVRVPSWSGSAANAFWDAFGPEAANWYRASDSFSAGANDLRNYAGELRAAQREAGEAIELWAKGEWKTAQAHEAWTLATRDLREDAPELSRPFYDPGLPLREQAQQVLTDARKRLDEAASTLRTRLVENSGGGEQAPGWLLKSAVAADAHLDGLGDTTVGYDKPGADPEELYRRELGDYDEDEPGGPHAQVNLAEWELGVEANLFEHTNEGETQLGDLTLQGSTEVKLGVEADASLTLSSEGLDVEAGGRVGLSVTADGSATIGPVEVDASGELEAGAEASAQASVGPTGAEVNAEFQAGVSVNAEGGVEVAGTRAAVEGEAAVGLGAEFDGEAGFEDGKLKIGGKMVAVLGVGGGFGYEFEVDVAGIAESVKDYGEEQAEGFKESLFHWATGGRYA